MQQIDINVTKYNKKARKYLIVAGLISHNVYNVLSKVIYLGLCFERS